MDDTSQISRLSWRVILFCMAATLSGCRQKELYTMQDIICTVEVEFGWEHAKDAAVEGMSTYFFPLDPDGKIWNFEISGKDGGPVAIPCGSYILAVVNNDLPGIDISIGNSLSSLTLDAVFTDDNTIRPSGMVYGAVIDKIHITPCGLSYQDGEETTESTHHIIKVHPDSLATVYDIQITGISNIDRILSSSARLSGVATSMTMDGIKTATRLGCLNIPLNISEGKMTGTTTGLGTPSSNPKFTLDVCVQFKDSKKAIRSFEVTQQIENAPYPHNVNIILSGIDFNDADPDPPDSVDVGSGVDVDGWSDININYKTGE